MGNLEDPEKLPHWVTPKYVAIKEINVAKLTHKEIMDICQKGYQTPDYDPNDEEHVSMYRPDGSLMASDPAVVLIDGLVNAAIDNGADNGEILSFVSYYLDLTTQALKRVGDVLDEAEKKAYAEAQLTALKKK